jgi:phospholipid transport system substrate-binding protein
MNKPGASILAVLLMLCLPAAHTATVEEPLNLIRGVTEDLLLALEQTPRLRTNPDGLEQLVEDIVLPHFDLPALSQLTLGKYWRQATPEQRERFTSEFSRLLIRTYSSSLTQHKSAEVEHQLLGMPEDKRSATVRTRVAQPGASAILIDYSLRRVDSGWKIYDVTIEGISMAVNYRATFSDQIRRGGLDALIETLAARNSDERRTQRRES